MSLRLTETEKRRLRALAEKNGLNLTDYILLSALHYSAADPYLPLLQKLYALRRELQELRKECGADAVCDALEKQAALYDELLAAIRCA